MAVEKNLPLEPLWQKVLAKTDGILPKDAVNQWISRIMPVALENGELVLAVRDTFTKQYIEPRYLALLGDAVHQALGADYTIRLVVDAKKAEPAKESILRPEPAPTKEEPKQSADTPAQGSLPLTPTPSDTHAAAPDDATTLNPKYTFDAFVTGRSNQFPYAMAKAVADAPGLPSHNPLFIYGGVGLGKTHLMHAVGHKILADHPDRRVLYIASTDFTNEFIRSIREKNMDAFREKYYSIDVLLIDDIQFFAGQEQTQTEFFQTFNKLRDNGSQIILTSDRQPQDVKGLEDRLISRFAGGAPVDIQPPEFETRVAILQKKAQSEEVDIPEDVVTYIASRVDSNIRELEGALTRLIKYASTMRMPIDETTCVAALGNYLRGETGRRITMEMIERIVCTHFKVTSEDIRSTKRSNDIAYPRQIAMYLCHELTDVSWPTIGGFFNRDHSTVIHAHKKIQSLTSEDAATDALVKSLSIQIRGI
ncbi:chromosomal replication initiator protein DnaA [Selenomonas noxia]|jgi:chromosomal replication initiator protein dnaA|uniref:Chromosomal replication initiator protein DnaA n=2 Tax=Selenomonas noxia TaxID=135083 RepID=A0ABN0DPT5_9FIRM|nr:chromosomal replication initiator protein DnaA [Selenomonas noxia]EFF67106.1 chromosomal replication initiator protein DnaA [Selenomonas noxia ATCC 43541]EHG24773.1 chromosomal replication initiator protein DnaA [Selenomonas noxia F0398]